MLFNLDTQRFVLTKAVQKLTNIQHEHRAAAGLIVAANIAHAHELAKLLMNDYGKTSVVVTYNDPEAQQKIEAFRTSSDCWIVSVGMIAEGTDIPRLRVCCLLSLARTELFFRQVLGRVLRLQPNILNDSGWLYCLAEPGLIMFAEQLEKEIPEQKLISRLNMNSDLTSKLPANSKEKRVRGFRNSKFSGGGEVLIEGSFRTPTKHTGNIQDQELLSVWMQGKFTERVLALIG
jgi:superfamily II DNA or RNA helicase